MRRLALALSAVALVTVATPQHALMQSAEDTAVVSAEQKDERRADLLRRANSYYGPVGGINVVEAGSGAPRSFRLSLYTDFFFKDDYLYDGDQNRYVGGALSLSITPIEHLEISAAVTGRSLRTRDRPPGTRGSETYNSIGDPYLDVKTYGEVAKGVTLGGDLLLNFLSAPADDGLDYAGTSFGVRANLSFDLREMAAHLPLELRLNAGYYFDQSRKVVEDEEDAALAALGPGVNPDDEVRHLAPRNERLAYNINRVDHFGLAVGLEAPLKLSKSVALHPILEWEMWMPLNRQGYDCPRTNIAGDDSCLDKEGGGAWPQRLTAGARLFPALQTFSLLAGVEVGLNGTKDFVREFAPVPPYRVFLSAAYTVDFAPKKAEKVEKVVEIPVAPKQGRLTGTVLEQGANTPVEGAQVVVQGQQLSPLVTGPDGAFVGYLLPPGSIMLSIAADGYEPGTCATSIPPEGGDAVAACSLIALPRKGSVAGSVVGKDNVPLANVPVQLTGPETRAVTTGPDGIFRAADLPPGTYQAHIDHEGFFLSNTPITIEPRKEATAQIALTPKPKKPLVVVQKTRLMLRGTVLFNTGTAELDARSTPLMTEIADVLLRMPEISKVEVQGHTDNVGAADFNQTLSQQRAEAVREWLIRAGVAPERLEAKGYGHKKPIAPNVTPAGKAKNRRVAFIITERATTLPTQ